ncbi:hypothetical protein ACFOTA_11720 [Chitinophaga sp. GCM10012297]|uniref:Uncharacterized protein n=1 Tax=Chitinophaga chungangae TaxID=2821488 RepID=A0ABS3YDW8_9BACT|nr:hypothetical protein [Chitinophaga chungangae]MBO9152879.1 hypothetical protein [Chitinophaga chungangae]
MNTNRKSPRAFRIDSSKTSSGPQYTSYHSRAYRCSANRPVGDGKIGFRAHVKNDAAKEEYVAVLKQIGLLSDVAVMGFDKAFEHSSPGDRKYMSSIKNENIETLLDALNERRGALIKQIYISC